jgi:dienelactone hydrolase
MAESEDRQWPEPVQRYLERIYAEGRRRHACRARTPEEFEEWQAEARPALRRLLGLDAIRESVGEHRPTIEFGEGQTVGDLTRRKGWIETEPDVRIPFWLVRPPGDGPFPLAVTPHGHNRRGFDTYAGVWHSEEERQRIEREDRDVALQAAREGFVAVSAGTRGIAIGGVTDLFGQWNGSDCTSHWAHAILTRRSSIGERVWDMERIIDWALGLPDVVGDDVLMMGNSGGGVLTTFAAACDTRVTIAVASCSFCPFVGRNGKILHHPCNAVPGIMGWGEFWDVAGLIAPRHFVAVHGTDDAIRPNAEVDIATERLRAIYAAAGVPERADQRYGGAGHRFYSDLMWPFIREARGRSAGNSNG